MKTILLIFISTICLGQVEIMLDPHTPFYSDDYTHGYTLEIQEPLSQEEKLLELILEYESSVDTSTYLAYGFPENVRMREHIPTWEGFVDWLKSRNQNVFYWKGTDIMVEVIERTPTQLTLRESKNGICIDFLYPADKFEKAVVECQGCVLDCF